MMTGVCSWMGGGGAVDGGSGEGRRGGKEIHEPLLDRRMKCHN